MFYFRILVVPSNGTTCLDTYFPLMFGSTRQHKWMDYRVGINDNRISNQRSRRWDRCHDYSYPCMFRDILQKRTGIFDGKIWKS